MATPRLTTAAELQDMPDDGYRYELVRGELRRVSHPGGVHGVLSTFIACSLHDAVGGTGLVLGHSGFLLAEGPDTVRAPDAAFISKARMPEEIPTGWWRVAPDLVAEVVSPNDRFTEVQEKIAEWLESGVRMVLLVDPTSRTVTAYRGRDAIETLRVDGIVDGGDVVPGWQMAVADLFATLG
ncbi:MAG: Uma2 family endonuclease [Planctomycetota bacterium]|jgi:Uma2 family endonuclease